MSQQDERQKNERNYASLMAKDLQRFYDVISKTPKFQDDVKRREGYYNEVLQFAQNPDNIEDFYDKLVYKDNTVSSVGASTSYMTEKEGHHPTGDQLHSVFSSVLSAVLGGTKDFTADNFNELQEQFCKAVGLKSSRIAQVFNRIIAAVFPSKVTPIPSMDNFKV